MTNVLSAIGWNLLIAALVGIAVWLLCRTWMLRQRPALCHGLWLLVLLKLVIPPLVHLSVLPASAPDEHRGITTTTPNAAEAIGDQTGSSSSFGDGANAIEGMSSGIAMASTETVDAEAAASRVDSSRDIRSVTWREIVIGLLGISLVGTLIFWLGRAAPAPAGEPPAKKRRGSNRSRNRVAAGRIAKTQAAFRDDSTDCGRICHADAVGDTRQPNGHPAATTGRCARRRSIATYYRARTRAFRALRSLV